MPHVTDNLTFTGVFPPRTVAFCRSAVATVLATLCLAVLLLLLGGLFVLAPTRISFAQTPQNTAEAVPAGLFFHADREEAALEAPLLKSEVQIAVNGTVARVKLRQHFLNPSTAWVEGVYVFPLPERSAVDRLILWVGEKRIKGQILERAQARKAYDTAAAKGQRASLLSSERPNVFTTSVANIGPGQEVVVEIEYQDAARFDDGLYSLRFPMVVAPRYSPPGSLEMAQDGATALAPVRGTPGRGRDLFGPVRHPDDPVPSPLSLSVALDAGVPLAGIESPYHAVNILETDARRRLVTLADGPVPANRDFVLEWRPALGGAPLASVFAQEVAGDSFLLVTLLPPAGDREAVVRPPRDVILVIDTSGSMHGASMAQAKTAVLRALAGLRPEDRFNVIRFASGTSSLFGDVRAASAQNLRRGARFVETLKAEGGTQMMPALIKALAKPAQVGRLRQVLFLTDGAVSNEAELFEIIAGLLGETRLFTVGIGSAPNSYFMRKASELGHGSFTHIGKVEEVAARMDSLLSKLEQAALTGLTTAWPVWAETGPEIYPSPLPDLYDGEPVSFTARVPGMGLAALKGALTLGGQRGDQGWSTPLALDSLHPAEGVAAIWARAKIAQIEDGVFAGIDEETRRAAALKVALDHRLVTKYSSLVAIDPDPVRPDDAALHSQDIPRALPAGWDFDHVFGAQVKEMKLRALPAPLLKTAPFDSAPISLPQTATPAALHALAALALVCGGLYVLLLSRRLGRAHGRG